MAPGWAEKGRQSSQKIGGVLCAVGAGGPVGPRKAKIRASALVRAGLAPLRGGPGAKIRGSCRPEARLPGLLRCRAAAEHLYARQSGAHISEGLVRTHSTRATPEMALLT